MLVFFEPSSLSKTEAKLTVGKRQENQGSQVLISVVPVLLSGLPA